MTQCCIIPNFEAILRKINDKRASRGDRVILVADWSAFLSSSSNNGVKKFWIDQMRRDICIDRDKALLLLGALNSVLRKESIDMVDASSLVCTKK